MANVIADALCRKTISEPMKGIYLRMTVITPVLEMIKHAQSEAVKEENQKK